MMLKLNSKLGKIFVTTYLVFTIVVYLIALFCSSLFCKLIVSLPVLIDLPFIGFLALISGVVWIWLVVFVFINTIILYFVGLGIEKAIQHFKQAQQTN